MSPGVFDGALGTKPTASERRTATEVGSVSILQGGPPCQGHSDLNNHTRRKDPKNALYLTMARAAEVLNPEIVIVENVAPVQRDQSGVVEAATAALKRADYSVAGRVLNLWSVGVPQRRRRFVLLASRVPRVEPVAIFDSVAKNWGDDSDRMWTQVTEYRGGRAVRDIKYNLAWIAKYRTRC